MHAASLIINIAPDKLSHFVDMGTNAFAVMAIFHLNFGSLNTTASTLKLFMSLYNRTSVRVENGQTHPTSEFCRAFI
jgi:hypothetical protein